MGPGRSREQAGRQDVAYLPGGPQRRAAAAAVQTPRVSSLLVSVLGQVQRAEGANQRWHYVSCIANRAIEQFHVCACYAKAIWYPLQRARRRTAEQRWQPRLLDSRRGAAGRGVA